MYYKQQVKKNVFSRLLKKAHMLRYASALAAHVPLKYAPPLDSRDALPLNLFEQPAGGILKNTYLLCLSIFINDAISVAKTK